MVRIIINADDFGYDDETVDATVACFEQGGLTSATIMANMPATEAAVEYALSHPQYSFGVHLNWVEGLPLTRPSDLITSQGEFRNSQDVRKRAVLNRIALEQIAQEARAQIHRIARAGVRISHVDSHGHLHKFRPFMEALQSVLAEFGIVRVRTAQDIYLRPAWKSPTYWWGPVWGRRIRSRYTTTDHLAMPAGNESVDWMERMVGACADGETLEVGVHPGRTEEWRALQMAGAVSLGEFARRRGHSLMTWMELN